MAIMNRVGTILYNIGLFLTIGIVFLALKNFNLSDFSETRDYSQELKLVLFVLIGLYYTFGLGLSVAALISKARKKGFFFVLMMLWFWLMMALNALYTFFPTILQDEFTTPAWRYLVIVGTVSLAFIPVLALIFYQFPGTVDKNILINDLKKKIMKEQAKSKSYCPMCKFPSEKEWKHCPKCGAHFSD